MDTSEFIDRAKGIHGDKYDYSKINYVSPKEKVCIICPEHGEFLQLPYSHLSGNGCKQCAIEKRKEKDLFISKCKKVHGDKYDYSKVNYITALKKICIVCPEHGEYWQKPNSHLCGCGCPECGKKIVQEKNSLEQSEFIKRAKEKHGDKYDYTKVEYVNSKTNICIICPKHGEFWQTPYSHLKNNGCKKCSNEKLSAERKETTKEWIEKAKKIHNNRYSYGKTIYRGYREKVIITCPVHGDFLQNAYDHIQGKGCQKCSRSKMEIDIEKMLIDNNIKYIYQYRPKFLIVGKSHFSLDFFLPDFNVAIECNGLQHFIGNTFYSQNIKKIIERDQKKNELCKKNNVNIIYYTDVKGNVEYFQNVIQDKGKLIEEIKNNERR